MDLQSPRLCGVCLVKAIPEKPDSALANLCRWGFSPLISRDVDNWLAVAVGMLTVGPLSGYLTRIEGT